MSGGVAWVSEGRIERDSEGRSVREEGKVNMRATEEGNGNE